MNMRAADLVAWLTVAGAKMPTLEESLTPSTPEPSVDTRLHA